MKTYQYHVIYKTTNTLNGKIYIGLHSTNRIEDGYLGTGWQLKKALCKYGKSAFTREVLHVFADREEARKKEAELVDEAFVARKDTYNMFPGGISRADQFGPNNPMYGKPALNAKKVQAVHSDGRVLLADSIRELGEMIGMARQNARKLLQCGRRGYRGWLVTRYVG